MNVEERSRPQSVCPVVAKDPEVEEELKVSVEFPIVHEEDPFDPAVVGGREDSVRPGLELIDDGTERGLAALALIVVLIV
ncbi:hypothetical protein QFC19_001817 [Naganishia cerealis]|uniref:Uncharacterized protein n=1 Tax=Naganishia cerealis TaxID=610337 RepID=A0ACC2WDL7_9TREE|nr:hypothetical protein QFC19_001817 [Naganishia cerealis]